MFSLNYKLRIIIRTVLICTVNIVSYGCVSNEKSDIPEHVKEVENVTLYSMYAKPATSIDLFREASYGSTENLQFIGFRGIAIDDAGRVYIGDSTNDLTIHVFRSDGSYLTNLGSRGSGPGEFRSIADIKIINDHLYAYDASQLKMNVYLLDTLELSHVINMNSHAANQDNFEEIIGWFSRQRTLRNNETFLVAFMKHPRDSRIDRPTYNLGKARPIKYYFMDMDGNIVSDKIFEVRDAKDLITIVNGKRIYNQLPLPFLGNSIISISDSDYIFQAWSEDFLIKVYDPNGNYLHAFYYPFKKRSMDRDEIIRDFRDKNEWNRTLVQHADLPETWPAIYSMIADDENCLWVSTFTEHDNVYEWWVLHVNGELIARFNWPVTLSIEIIKEGYVYARETDEKTGLQKIIRYRIEMEEV